MTKKIYLSGALTGIDSPDELKAFYEGIGYRFSQQGFTVYIPHLASDPVLHQHLSSNTVWKMDYERILWADTLAAYVGIASLGVGAELEIARQHSKPIILIYETAHKVSRMVLGNPMVKAEIVAEDKDALLAEVEVRGALIIDSAIRYLKASSTGGVAISKN